MFFFEDFFFGFFDIIFPLMFILVFSMIIITFVKNMREWNSNNKQPVLSVAAKVVAKRTNFSRHHHKNHSSSSTTYYITFEVESGDRLEFRVSGEEYGLLVEGDVGKLTFQGTRFLKFERAV